METPLAELAEDTAVHLLPRPGFELLDRAGFVYEAGGGRSAVHRIRLGDVDAAVAWTRADARARGHREVEWWVGWSAIPGDLGDRLLGLGLVPDEVPVLTGMTCTVEPPEAPQVEVQAIRTFEQLLEALQVDWEVWRIPADEREQRVARQRARFDPDGTVRHYAAFLDGRLVGFGRGIDMDAGVALMGGAVLPEARGRGVYRALVRARWEHAVARGTPLLVVQAGELSGPVLDGLGFSRHGEIRLYADRL